MLTAKAFRAILLIVLSTFCGGLRVSRNGEVNIRPPVAKPIQKPKFSKDYYWDLFGVAFSLLPLAPGSRRRTLVDEIVPNNIWTLDQIQGIVNINVPVRSTIVRLKDGGLLVYNPVAPTKECIDFVRTIESQFGPVKHIVLGSLGLEHKALCGPFTRYFPNSDVWIQPGQWSFPIDLPPAFLGFPIGRRLKEIPLSSKNAPWAADFDHASLGPLRFKSVGGFGETAFFHRSTKTLLVTDVIVKVTDKPPAIIEEDPRALLFHSRDKIADAVIDTQSARLKGWKRMVLFALFFLPSGITVSGIKDALTSAFSVSPESKLLGDGAVPLSLYPWSWDDKARDDEKSYKAVEGGLLVAPILSKLILNREPEKVLEWVDTVSRWPIARIIPCHLENNLKANSNDFRAAFSFLSLNPMPRKVGVFSSKSAVPLEADLFLLNSLSDIFTRLGIVDVDKVKSAALK